MANVNHIVKLFGDPTPFYYYIIEVCNAPGFTGIVESNIILQVGEVIGAGYEGEFETCVKVITEIPETTPDIYFIEKFDSCKQCIACNGIYYVLLSCSSESTSAILSYSSYQPGDYIQIGYECFYVITSTPFADEYIFVYSAPYCDSCNPTKKIMIGTTCQGDTSYNYIYVDETAVSGDVVSTKIYESFAGDCVVLNQDINPLDISFSGTVFIDSVNQENCDSCNRNLFPLVIRFANCSDLTEVYEGVLPWISVINFDMDNFIFSFGGPECYLALEPVFDTCPFKNQQVYFPAYYYQTCEECYQPLSAGTEYKMCMVDCSGTTVAVSTPHPIWTNNQGKAVVLLDAVVLGGQNGLYN